LNAKDLPLIRTAVKPKPDASTIIVDKAESGKINCHWYGANPAETWPVIDPAPLLGQVLVVTFTEVTVMLAPANLKLARLPIYIMVYKMLGLT
jgi:hypothetical protein